MKCPRCSTEIPDNAAFCNYCGFQLSVRVIRTRGSYIGVVFGVVGLLALVGAAMLYLMAVNHPIAPDDHAASVAPQAARGSASPVHTALPPKLVGRVAQTPAPAISPSASPNLSPPVSQVLADQPVSVAPRGHTIGSRFSLLAACRIEGFFRAQGGRGNDIQAIIVDEVGLQNLTNGNQFHVYYDSGKVTVGIINTVLGPGRYFLVFSNHFSLLTGKTVTLQLRQAC